MLLPRRSFLLASLSSALATCSGCSRGRQETSEQGDDSNAEPPFSGRMARACKRGADYLQGKQSEDGAWRSDTYGTLKDGTGLTPLALNALLACAPDRTEPIRKAAEYLAAMVQPDGRITPPAHGFDFAVYTAALTVSALSHSRCSRQSAARDAWLRFLKQRQLTEGLGWKPEDQEYGGWGYSRGLPRKPRAGELALPLTESNLSATTFALDALSAAGVPAKDSLLAKALTFVQRCQNWQEDPARREAAFDDGGFFFIYGDPVRNKAGVAGTDRQGRQRYHSYGSATADGLRCMAHCGVPESDSRLRAAQKWLQQHFQAGCHPGVYAERREMDRMAVFYYYAASASKQPAGSLPVDAGKGRRPLRELLAEELLVRQRADGSWLNPAHAIREDDPITATSFALTALGTSLAL